MTRLADEVREYVLVALVKPTRRRRERVLRVRAGDVHRAMGLTNRMPAVCGALDAGRFEREAGVVLLRREGPRQGANARWTFALRD